MSVKDVSQFLNELKGDLDSLKNKLKDHMGDITIHPKVPKKKLKKKVIEEEEE